jgi:hypothetical protein
MISGNDMTCATFMTLLVATEAQVIEFTGLHCRQERRDLGARKSSAGPDGCRELRIAITPPGNRATSTQQPEGLLARLLRQRATGR